MYLCVRFKFIYIHYITNILAYILKNPPTNYSQGDSFLNLIKFFYSVSSALLVSDSGLVGCRPRDLHRNFLLRSPLVTFYKNIFRTFRTKLCMLQYVSKATIFGRRLVLLAEDCDLRLHRNLATEILERRTCCMSDFEILSLVLMILGIIASLLIAFINQSKK